MVSPKTNSNSSTYKNSDDRSSTPRARSDKQKDVNIAHLPHVVEETALTHEMFVFMHTESNGT